MPKGLSQARVWELENGAFTTYADHAQAGGFLHYCADWDFLLIDQTDDEFDCCTCSWSPDFDPKTGKPRLQA